MEISEDYSSTRRKTTKRKITVKNKQRNKNKKGA
jgi:hypothetical protein